MAAEQTSRAMGLAEKHCWDRKIQQGGCGLPLAALLVERQGRGQVRERACCGEIGLAGHGIDIRINPA